MKKRLGKVIAIAGIFAVAFSTPILAENTDTTGSNAVVYEISMADTNPVFTLESKYLDTKGEEGLSLINIDPSETKFDVEGLEIAKTGIQKVHVNMTIVTTDDTNTSVSSDYSEDILVKMIVSKAPQIILSSGNVEVDYQSEFNANSYITYVGDASGNLPVLKIDSNVDTNTEGTYEVTYTVVNQLGNTSAAKLSVKVRKSEAQLAAEAEEAARIAAEEEAQRQAEAAAAAQAARVAAYSYDGPTTATGSSIVGIARSWVGVGSYVYGGNDPATGVDCSGFTKYVYSQIGININRVAADQTANGYLTDTPQPGDLAIWTGHAAIYSGNGYIINAMNPRAGIQEIPISGVIGSGAFLGYYHVYGVE